MILFCQCSSLGVLLSSSSRVILLWAAGLGCGAGHSWFSVFWYVESSCPHGCCCLQVQSSICDWFERWDKLWILSFKPQTQTPSYFVWLLFYNLLAVFYLYKKKNLNSLYTYTWSPSTLLSELHLRKQCCFPSSWCHEVLSQLFQARVIIVN